MFRFTCVLWCLATYCAGRGRVMPHAINSTLALVTQMLQCLNCVQGEVLNHARSKNTFFLLLDVPNVWPYKEHPATRYEILSALLQTRLSRRCVRTAVECSNAFRTVVFRFYCGIIKAYIYIYIYIYFFCFEYCSLYTVTCNIMYCDTEMKETIAWMNNGWYNASELQMLNIFQ